MVNQYRRRRPSLVKIAPSLEGRAEHQWHWREMGKPALHHSAPLLPADRHAAKTRRFCYGDPRIHESCVEYRSLQNSLRRNVRKRSPAAAVPLNKTRCCCKRHIHDTGWLGAYPAPIVRLSQAVMFLVWPPSALDTAVHQQHPPASSKISERPHSCTRAAGGAGATPIYE